jgi:very-short-patch-repair endonuclease/predicted transcriptional regulator of viral defense system
MSPSARATSATPVLSSAERDALLWKLASRQHGIVTARQLHLMGIDRHFIHRRVKRGYLHQIHRGVYAVGHPELSLRSQWMAATLAGGDGAALSHLAAASLWGIWKRAVHGIDVVSPRAQSSRDGITYHRSREMRSTDVTTREQIRVTTIARTIIDLGDHLTAHQLASVLYEADYWRLLDMARLEELIDRSLGRHQIAIVREAIALRATGSAGTRSPDEDRLLVALMKTPWSACEVNVRRPIPGGTPIELDFCWPHVRLNVEVDGSGHRRPEQVRADRKRDARLRAAGYTIMRFAGRDVRRGAGRVVDQVVKTLEKMSVS